MAREFNGFGDRYVFDAVSSQRSFTAFTFSLMAWRDGPGQNGYGVMFHQGDDGAQHNSKWEFGNDNGDVNWGLRFVTWHNNASSPGAWSIPYPTNGQWHSYIVSYDGSSTSNNPTIYKDGIAQTVIKRLHPSGALPTKDSKITIGARPTGSSTWLGKICEFAMWNRILTASEAAQIGKGYSALFVPNGLVMYDPMVRVTTDVVGGGVPTMTGTTAYTHPLIVYPTPQQITHIASQVGFVPRLSLLGVG